jgi:hypothetical protein
MHPGRLGHALIARDLFDMMLKTIRARRYITYGGVQQSKFEEVAGAFKARIQKAAGDDQVFRLTGGK